MPAVPPGPLDRTERAQVAAYLAERLAGSVGLDVWTRDEGSALVRTDRDVCTHCPDVLALMRQLATLHPALTITPYDLTRHADRAQQAGIALAPTTVVRGRGRALQLVGLFSGLLFPLMLDLIAYVSNGWSPVQDETREGLQALTGPVEVEAMVSPYDAYSAHLARVVGAFAVESRAIRARIIEMAEFPVLAGQRSLVEVPALTINGRRFTGAWDEAELLEQLRRVLAGDAQLVVRNRVLVTRYVTEEEAHELARQHVTAEAEARGLAPEPWAPAAGTPPPDTPPPRPP
ncbi:MAG: hypothetical protein FJZ92_13780, partial [Chloroflexi bacterium]|nr:hypothetical protein [Chloroflexota bacterium]